MQAISTPGLSAFQPFVSDQAQYVHIDPILRPNSSHPQPSSAASSFVSGLIREPLQGIRTTLPIASSPDDPNVEQYPLYCTKVTTVLRNIAYAGCMPEDRFPKGEGRSINLPGVRVTPKQMLAAL